MKKCFTLAKQGLGKTSPNPLVGCVILDKFGNEISTGYHAKYGENHAERDALLKLKNNEAEDGTLIVNLEPCSHFGKTPPCVDLIIERKLKKVVIAMKDPNPIVSSIEKLKSNGIEVIENILENEAKELNEIFIKNKTENKPFIVLKTATTIDGKIATKTGDSKWITSNEAREKSHELRTLYDAVLTTSSTVLADDPSFDCPKKILIDRNLKTNFEQKYFKTGEIFVAVDKNFALPKSKPENVNFIQCPCVENELELDFLFNELFKKGIMSIFVECGGILNGELISKNLVDKIYHFFAPKILGDNSGKSAFSGRNIDEIKNCINFEIQNIEKLNDNVLITYKKAIFE